MRWLPLLTFIVLVLECSTKDKVIYQVTGADLFDLIRNMHHGPLKLMKVEGDKTNLQDGIYYEPEDVALSDDEPKELYINVRKLLTSYFILIASTVFYLIYLLI